MGAPTLAPTASFSHNAKETPQETIVPILYLLGGAAPDSAQELARLVGRRLGDAIEAWREGNLTEKQAVFLDEFVRRDLLPRSLEHLESLSPLVTQYRVLEQEVPVARRAPGVVEEGSPDQPLLVRGSHKNLGQPVPRRFLTALQSDLYEDPGMVRLRLAEEIASPANPLTARVDGQPYLENTCSAMESWARSITLASWAECRPTRNCSIIWPTILSRTVTPSRSRSADWLPRRLIV